MIEADPLRLGMPEPPARPGELADFSYLDVPAAGSVRRPEVDTSPSDMRDLAHPSTVCSTTTAWRSIHGTRTPTLRRYTRACAGW